MRSQWTGIRKNNWGELVTDIDAVHVGKGADQLSHGLLDEHFCEIVSVLGDLVEELAAVQVFHHDEDVVDVDVVLVDLDDVRVVHLRQQFDFLADMGDRSFWLLG